MSSLFPYANVLAGMLVLIVGFGFHFVGQLISVLDWKLAQRLGLQEAGAPPDYYPYEHGTAIADVLIGWTYPIAGIGLILGASWGYGLAVLPGAILLYHGISFWFWEADRRAAGHGLVTDIFRTVWVAANVLTGLLALAVAWAGPVS